METKDYKDNIPDTTSSSWSEDHFDEKTNTDNDITDIQIDAYWWTKTYKKWGKQIYEIEEPLNQINDIYIQVSKEEFDVYQAKVKKLHEEQSNMYKDRTNTIENFRQKWWVYIAHETDTMEYKKRLINLMDEQHIDHIQQLPSYKEQAGTETKIQLFGPLAKQEKTPDYYEKFIINFIEKNEQTISEIWIEDEEICRIESMFSKGYITDLSLFHRFETLKRKNQKYHYKRIYLYGNSYEHKNIQRNRDYYKNKREQPEIQPYLDYFDVVLVEHFLRDIQGQMSDLDEEKNVLGKIKRSYQQQIKLRLSGEIFIGKYITPEDIKKHYQRFTTQSLCKLWFSPEELLQAHDDAQTEFVKELTQVMDIANIDNIGHITGTGMKKFYGKNIFTKRMSAIQKRSPDQSTDKIKNRLQNCITDGIQKIIVKEKTNTTEWKDRKQLSYKRQITKLVDLIDSAYEELEKLDISMAEATKWKTNRASYIADYISFYKENFIQKRIAETLKADINDPKAIEQQILQDVQHKLYSLCIKECSKQRGTHITHNYLSTGKMIKYIKAAFLQTGHAILLKHLYPDDKQRRSIRQKYVQTIIKNLLTQINTNAQDIATFSIIEYQMIQPLIYWYEKYWGTKIHLIKHKKIETTLAQYHIQTLQQSIQDKITKTQKILAAKKSEIPLAKTYSNIIECIDDLKRYLSLYIKRGKNLETTQAYTQTNQEYNRQSWERYDDLYIEYASRFHVELSDIEKYIPQEAQEMLNTRYHHIENLRNQTLQHILTRRVNANGHGKMERVSQEFIQKKFGLYTGSAQQIDALLDMLSEKLFDIIITDLKVETHEYMLFGRDREKIKTYISHYIQYVREQRALGSDRTQDREA